MTPATLLSKWTCAAALFSAALLATWALLRDPESWPNRAAARYVAHLDRVLRALFLPAHGRFIGVGQLLALEAVALASVWFGQPGLLLGVPLVLAGPAVWLERRRVRRVRHIEAQVDGFLLSLANALRATPNLARALAQTQALTPRPLSDELGLALDELRVGASLEQALSQLGGRVRCSALDSALLAVLIGRQVGGDLTKVLETTAATLREMARLRGVLRAKTAEAKAQMWVLALVPAFVLFAFDAAKPGYFEPLLADMTGWLIIAVAGALWAGSLLIARNVLAVRI